MAFENSGHQKRNGNISVNITTKINPVLFNVILYCSFNADVRLDQKENKVNLYPDDALNGRKGDDYVQSELRRLRENLRCESSKLRRPSQFVISSIYRDKTQDLFFYSAKHISHLSTMI